MDDKRSKFEPFECGPGLMLAAHEKVSKIHHENLLQRLGRLEEMMERLERRLWLAVYGVVAVILGQAVQSIVVAVP